MIHDKPFPLSPSIRVFLVALALVFSGCVSPPVEDGSRGEPVGQDWEDPDSPGVNEADEEDYGGDSTGDGSSVDDEAEDPGKEAGDEEQQGERDSDSGKGKGEESSGSGGNGTGGSMGSGDGNGDSSGQDQSGGSGENDDGGSDGGGGSGGGDESEKGDEKSGGDEGDGKDEEDGLRVEVSHGSVEVFASGGFITLDPPNMKGQSEFLVDGSLVVGFLAPGTEYRAVVDGEEITFVTKENPYSWSGSALVYPGVKFFPSGCTMGFIFQDALNESVYGMTAAHCVELGDEVFVDGELVGKVVVHRYEGGWDLALVEIFDRSKVSPSLPYFSGPTGLVASVPDDATLCFYGAAGMVYPVGSMSLSDNDGGARCGYNISDFTETYRFRMTGPGGYAGDSGSPVIHYETGAAYGINSGGLPGLYKVGNTICHAMGWLSDKGYDLLLSTHSYDPGPAKPLPESADEGEVKWCDY